MLFPGKHVGFPPFFPLSRWLLYNQKGDARARRNLKFERAAALRDELKKLSELLARIKATPRQPGVAEIRIPSERSFRERARQLREGISIDRSIFDALEALAYR